MNGGLGGNRDIGTYVFGDAWHTFRSQRRHPKSWIRRPEMQVRGLHEHGTAVQALRSG